jgi:hypothetical protein
MAKHQVRALLMGGQACVFYGAAEFSRDTDLAISADTENWGRLTNAMAELRAEAIAVPPSNPDYLRRGFALHYRCKHEDAPDMRVDVMSVMRGVEEFQKLWERRVELADQDGTVYPILALSDLVRAKKTQRSKDWPMIQRLVEADYASNRQSSDKERVRFWLLEMRSPALLVEVAAQNRNLAAALVSERKLLEPAIRNQTDELAAAIEEEERLERERDRIYWQPLKAELERLRHKH